MFAQNGTEETVRVSNNYRQKHLAKLVMAYNTGMASFLLGPLDYEQLRLRSVHRFGAGFS